MNFAALLDYGPRLGKRTPEQVKKSSRGKRYSPKKMSDWRSKSIDGQIWSTLISSHTGVMPGSVAKDLKEMYEDGYLLRIGKHMESNGSSKPWLYQWK